MTTLSKAVALLLKEAGCQRYQESLIENIERTQRNLSRQMFKEPVPKESLVDLVNHLGTQLQELRHARREI